MKEKYKHLSLHSAVLLLFDAAVWQLLKEFEWVNERTFSLLCDRIPNDSENTDYIMR